MVASQTAFLFFSLYFGFCRAAEKRRLKKMSKQVKEAISKPGGGVSAGLNSGGNLTNHGGGGGGDLDVSPDLIKPKENSRYSSPMVQSQLNVVEASGGGGGGVGALVVTSSNRRAKKPAGSSAYLQKIQQGRKNGLKKPRNDQLAYSPYL